MVDFSAEGLLDGLTGDARDEREALLRWLHEERGVPLERLRTASQAGTVTLLAAEDALGATPTMTQRELAEELGVDVELLQRHARAQGLPPKTHPDALEVSEVEAQSARHMKAFLDAGLTDDQVLATSRVLGRGLGQIAEVMRQQTLLATLRPGATELELAQAFTAMAEVLIPMVGPMLDTMLRVHLDQVVGDELANADERLRGQMAGARPTVVAFADLVGFTRLGEQLEPDVLGHLALRLDVLAGQSVEAGVRHVKSIGDAVMLAAATPDPLLRTVFRLREHAEEAELPELRVGVASGEAVLRAGDLFGRPVNLASRVQHAARAGSVLVTEPVKDAADERLWRFSYAGARRLKGLSAEQKLFRVRGA